MYDVIVIGGGAAGMMAAGTAARHGKTVLLLEKNNLLGKKLMITGKGRCNVTNMCDMQTFLAAITANPKFLYSAYSRFTSQDTVDFFTSLGVNMKTERGNRVFPASDRAADIVNALKKYISDNGVSAKKAAVSGIQTSDGKVTGVVLSGGSVLDCTSAIICTGGLSYPLTGSTGDGYAMARACGHNIVPPTPSLVPLNTVEPWVTKLQGLSLKNVDITLREDDQIIYREQGEMLFTHFGVSGPVILSLSAHIKDIAAHKYTITIDLKPALDLKTLDARLLRDFDANINRDFANALSKLLPQKLIPIIIDLCGIDPNKKVHQITKTERTALLRLLKDLPLTIKSMRPIDEAIITKGGVDVSGVDPSTMQSKLIHGLYFAGEVLDTDAYTGGFNLQIAFSTGHLAANNC